jgi:hypothetical protein
MKLYLDDERPAPPGWRLLRWPDEVIDLLETGEVTDLSLDHDLGDDARGTGYDVILWIERAVATGDFTPPALTVHSANTAARARMQAGIASIDRLVRQRRDRLAAHSPSELVHLALASPHEIKAVLPLLERHPPDDAAAAIVLAASAAPAWLVAALLGSLRVASGYARVHEILARGPGLTAEGHAAAAMARIDPARARDDLLSLLTRGDSRRIREAAAAGLARLADPGLAPQLLAAWRARRILRDCAAAALAALPSPADLRLALHHSDDPDERDLAARIDAAAVDR